MNKKKVDSILKGVAAAGLAIGGVSSIQGVDVVMAAEISDSASMSDSDSENASTSDRASDSPSESRSDSQSESATSESGADDVANQGSETEQTAGTIKLAAKAARRVMPASDGTPAGDTGNTTAANANDGGKNEDETNPADDTTKNGDEKDTTTENETGIGSQITSVSVEESELVSDSAIASASVSAGDSELASASASASLSENSLSTSVLEKESEYQSTSTSLLAKESEYLSTSTSLSEQMSEAESLYQIKQSEFNASGVRDEYLESLITDINNKQKKLQDVLDKAVQEKPDVTLDHVKYYGDKENYWTLANDLANAIIKYRYYQEEQVKKIDYSGWQTGQGTAQNGNYVKVDYKDKDQKDQTSYFDYVVTDSTGKVIGYDNATGKVDAANLHAKDVKGIAILKKHDTIEKERGDFNWNKWEWEYKDVLKFVAGNKEVKYSTYDANGYLIKDDNNGNFNVKGDYYFSTDSYKRGEDKYSQDKSELNSVASLKNSLSGIISEQVSGSASLSDKISEQVSGSASLSAWKESHSADQSSSLSGSESASGQRSTSLDTSESGYQSTSSSLSTLKSLLQSQSTSILNSQSASASASESQSVSASQSTSASVSESHDNSMRTVRR